LEPGKVQASLAVLEILLGKGTNGDRGNFQKERVPSSSAEKSPFALCVKSRALQSADYRELRETSLADCTSKTWIMLPLETPHGQGFSSALKVLPARS
jgi:hypothetical protein